ncbi:hypothetical protein [Xanthomonas campestris]|uniref:hypothetical protein n=2 Tax=Xanthomonas campestris TaxID=339 RepID=UPI0021615AFF|nr:hypothetical protein [Xanthomonas campestris]
MSNLLGIWTPNQCATQNRGMSIDTILSRWHGMVLAVVCLMQFATSLVIKRRYEKGLARQFFWVIWYPVAFWMTGMLTAVIAVPRALLARRSKRARWKSPDRGIQ